LKRHLGFVVLLGFVLAVVVWVIAFHSPGWAAPVTQPLFWVGSMLEIALTPGAPTRVPELSIILLGYAVNFLITWTLMASMIELIMRLTSEGKVSA
jgi:hypothetical protein